MPKSKQKNWYESLDKDTREIVLAVGLIVFVLILAFFLSNPVLAGVIFVTLGLSFFTIYAKYKTGRWWWKSNSQKSSPQQVPANPPHIHGEPLVVERETTTKEVFVRRCAHCGAKVAGTRTNCPNCGAVL